MNKIIILILVVLLALSLAAPAYCGPVEKIGRGVSNMLTFPCEVPWRIKQSYDQNGITGALSWGVLNGVFMAGYRAILGAYETATFFLPFPGDFQPILTDPEFFFETKN